MEKIFDIAKDSEQLWGTLATAIDTNTTELIDMINSSVVNNHNYLKNWGEGNAVIKRLYIQNKEIAVSNNLFVKSIFYNYNNEEGNSGINFGIPDNQWFLSIPAKGNPEKLYIKNAIFGEIAVWFDWSAFPNNVEEIALRKTVSETNIKDIAYNYDNFIKSDDDVKPILSEYTLYSLGDSLSVGGVWQQKFSELTGCQFSQDNNIKSGAPLSVGGTKSYGQGFDNMLWRAKNLVDSNYIADEGAKAIIVLENVNDASLTVSFDASERTIIPTDPIEGYSYDSFGSDLLNQISSQKAINACLRLTKIQSGKNLSIANLPTKEGNVTLFVAGVGTGTLPYNIYVIPQATEEETRQYIIDKILEYNYTGVTDVLSDDGVSIDFAVTNEEDYLPTVSFVDTDNTGMTVNITDTANAKSSIAMYYIANTDSIEDWTNTSNWMNGVNLNFSMGWKSTIELLQRNFPKAHIFVSMFPLHAVTSSDFLLPTGAYDTYTYSQTGRMKIMEYYQNVLKQISEFYSVPFLNIF